MRERHQLFLEPGADIRDRLFELGVEFPCGSDGMCGGCRIRVIEGDVPVTREMSEVLSPGELAEGWRLGCRASAAGAVTIEVGQWAASILTDETKLKAEPQSGFGVVIDLGTTTLVGQLVNLEDGEVVSVESGLNPQARYGADIMSRVNFDLRSPGSLGAAIVEAVGRMVESLAKGRELREVLLCGNTVMHHLFCGIDVGPLAAAPFRPADLTARSFTPSKLGWSATVRLGVTFLPCIGGFVGSDILAGIAATGLLEQGSTVALMDLGTNGEIALHVRGRLLCASTAAGPAFEGGRIGMGMRAGAGAIDQVSLDGNQFVCHVLGGGEARGLCGSGLVDAVASALLVRQVQESGKLIGNLKALALTDQVSLSQRDIRELQLAKGAVAAGLRILLKQGQVSQLDRIDLAGAFGNYVRASSAMRIGLLPGHVQVEAVGNTALRGTRALLLAPSRRDAMVRRLLEAAEHVELSADPEFQDSFVDCMPFPTPA